MGRGGIILRRNGFLDFLDLLSERAIDALFDFGKRLFGKKREPEEFTAIKMVPNTDPDRDYHSWISGERVSLNDLPEVQLTVLECDKTADELAEIICSDNPLVLHTGHADESCPGKPLSEGLKEIFSGQPSTWEIRTAFPSGVSGRSTPNVISILEMFLAQEFEGSKPGNPNRDICTIFLDRSLAPMKLELRIPCYGARDGYFTIVYLKIELEINPSEGIIVTGHEDNTDPRPR